MPALGQTLRGKLIAAACDRTVARRRIMIVALPCAITLFHHMRVSMVSAVGSATVKAALAAWLLLTNLSLGQYHRHEPGHDAHRAAPNGWHYHVLLLGVELDFLSVNSESSPFQAPSPAEHETHLLLGHLVAPATDHDLGVSLALLLAVVPPAPLAVCESPDALALVPAPMVHDVSGLPPPASVLSARSGAQQV